MREGWRSRVEHLALVRPRRADLGLFYLSIREAVTGFYRPNIKFLYRGEQESRAHNIVPGSLYTMMMQVSLNLLRQELNSPKIVVSSSETG